MTETCLGPETAPAEAEAFYARSVRALADSGIPFLVAGTYAVNAYTGMQRPTKDMDVFCKAGDFPRILTLFQDQGETAVIEDERWLAKIRRGPLFFDVIFNSRSTVAPVNDLWFEEAQPSEIHGTGVLLVPPTEMIWSKIFVQNRTRYDGADIAHLILKCHDRIDWRRLLSYMEPYWEVLLAQVLNFRFIYPSERDLIPAWLFDELLERAAGHARMPAARMRVCRGRLLAPEDYLVDVRDWGFADILGQPE
jgi:hypothetical protein